MNNISNKPQKNKLTFTVGIATRCGGPGLVPAVRSILDSEGVPKFRFIVIGEYLPADQAQILRSWGVEVVEHHTPTSLPGNIRKKMEMCDSDILICTHDDIKFAPNTLREILNVFESDPEVTMVLSKVVPMESKSFLEKILRSGVDITYGIAKNWKGADNYLLSNGRCMCWRVSHLKKMNILDKVTNADAHLYFENRFKGGKFVYADKAWVYNRNPKCLAEYLNQSRRFQFSRQELSQVFKKDLSEEYQIYKELIVKSVVQEFIRQPFWTLLYLCLSGYGRLFKGQYRKIVNPLWKVDQSTKEID